MTQIAVICLNEVAENVSIHFEIQLLYGGFQFELMSRHLS